MGVDPSQNVERRFLQVSGSQDSSLPTEPREVLQIAETVRAAPGAIVPLAFFFLYFSPPDPRDGPTGLCCRSSGTRRGIGRLWPDIYFGVHLPRRKKTIETFLEVAGRSAPGSEPVTSRSRQRRHGYVRLRAKHKLREALGHPVGQLFPP